MDVAITGSTGLIGAALARRLAEDGHTVRRVVRRVDPAPGDIGWDPVAGTIDTAAMAGVNALIHLAGEGIATRRWTAEQKRLIRDSRVLGTTLMAKTVAALDPRPVVLLNASAVGFYGDRGEKELTETSPAGDGFLPEVVKAWEASTEAASIAGVRTVLLRTGIVLATEGGALAKQLPLFRMGLGGRFGSGRQWMSWIALADVVGAIAHLLTSKVSGPVNLTAPNPATNADYTRILAGVLGRPAILPTPKFGPELMLGRELTQALLYSSTKAMPAVLLADAYQFRHADLEAALRAILQRSD